MKAMIVIPARFASSRLPGKPLLVAGGKPLIQHTYEKAAGSSADRVIVATDDERILKTVQDFGGEAVMTSADHQTGTARVAEAADRIAGEGEPVDIVVNMQGDEPETDPAHLDALIAVHRAALAGDRPAFVSTLVCPFAPEPVDGPGSPQDPSCVKALLGHPRADGGCDALYFSRALTPYPRDDGGRVSDPTVYYLHIGIYAFSAASLRAYDSLPAGRLEAIEKLEQLRILEAGERIAAAIVPQAAPGIDTPADFAAFKQRLAGTG
ncbi:3-deoxy-manno-octulosonate cytidylyltransferase [Aquisalinus flavus]|uniref:3-deoxy-manno-octulosonate cytidylyltransferase n=1 Tax=Aquisalinus flavus TaxID=1526572 RepID=A0A8J2V5J6_9PROT|nr:3-deoxy-manno-octulosonate cytidylyltransferase [Aquisalinus flavus]MBD0426347.1 3-deoxy-manno-octulosonate cytidylyltransferase [Aquisalinus flavus]UNE48087.1 3-deoxy-manno-octulosonate cytidylyltransferase [Aquisalinus flavus]GGD08701.1 3-deoxy-manno-octulosonate cytidylyltransferase [Aquisalinus flavus]